MNTGSFYLPITKIDQEQRMVWGYASTPTLDLDGEVIELDAIKGALPGYMEWRPLRVMHQPIAAGTTKEANIDDNGLYIGAKVVDDDAWKKVIEGVYRGFSIGGSVKSREGNRITGLDLIEISLVDRPANPDCKIDVVKVAEGGAPTVALEREEVGLLGRLLAKLARKYVEEADTEPYGDVEYADPGYQEDSKKRYPIDTEEHIRAAWKYIQQANNAEKYSAEQVASIKRRIVAAWKKKIGGDGPPEAKFAPAGKPGAADRESLGRDDFERKRPGKAAPEVRETATVIGRKNDGGEAETLTRAASIWSGVTLMAETEIGKRAASGVHVEHMRKAMFHLGEAHKRCGAGMSCMARAMGDDAEKAAGQGQLAKAAGHFEKAQEHHILAHHHMTAASGHKGERGEEPGDAEGGIYMPEEGLAPLSQSQLAEGNVPEYAVDRPYPGKAAAATLKEAQDELLKKAEEAAYLRGKVEALEKMPTHPKARLFAVPRGSLNVGEAEEPSAMEKLLKGVNLDAASTSERQAAGGRLIGNMIANSATFARPVLMDPTFHGGAGR